jgi:hypothetical protein
VPGLQLRGEFPEPVTATRDEHDIHACRREPARESLADSAGRTGHHRRSVREFPHDALDSSGNRSTPHENSRSIRAANGNSVSHLPAGADFMDA